MVQALEKCQLAETVKEKDGKLDSLGELALSLFLTILQLGVNSSIRYRNLLNGYASVDPTISEIYQSTSIWCTFCP